MMSEFHMNEPVIDRAVFLELQQAAGTEFVAELVETFSEEATGLLRELQESFAAQDAERFRRAAHSLKSNGSTFGALRLAELARECELGGLACAVRDGLPLHQLKSAFDQAALELKALCRD
jgi:histidine phosphotransfer protein HptB